MKVLDLALGSAICLFGVFIGYVFLRDLELNNLAISRKLVIGVVVPGAIILIGLKRILKKRNAAPRN